jgi:hypothetical protein
MSVTEGDALVLPLGIVRVTRRAWDLPLKLFPPMGCSTFNEASEMCAGSTNIREVRIRPGGAWRHHHSSAHSAPDLSPIVESLARLRAEMAVLKHFGALEETKNGLSRVLAFLEDLTTIQNPDDEEDPNETTPPQKKDLSGKEKKDKR